MNKLLLVQNIFRHECNNWTTVQRENFLYYYRFNRGEKAVEWAEKNIKKVFMNLNKKLRNVWNKKTSAVILFWVVRFTEGVYSGKFHAKKKKRVRFMIVRFIEIIL